MHRFIQIAWYHNYYHLTKELIYNKKLHVFISKPKRLTGCFLDPLTTSIIIIRLRRIISNQSYLLGLGPAFNILLTWINVLVLGRDSDVWNQTQGQINQRAPKATVFAERWMTLAPIRNFKMFTFATFFYNTKMLSGAQYQMYCFNGHTTTQAKWTKRSVNWIANASISLIFI